MYCMYCTKYCIVCTLRTEPEYSEQKDLERVLGTFRTASIQCSWQVRLRTEHSYEYCPTVCVFLSLNRQYSVCLLSVALCRCVMAAVVLAV